MCTIYGGWAGRWGFGRVVTKKLKNLEDLLAIHLPRWKRPKQEESTIDRIPRRTSD